MSDSVAYSYEEEGPVDFFDHPLFGGGGSGASTSQEVNTTTTDNITTYNNNESPLTDGQETVLSLLQVFSSLLSLVGSSIIVYKVIRNRTKTTPYDRIMLGLSTTDIIASISYGLGPFLLPQSTSTRIWAFGSTGTCTLLGFMTQLSFWAVWYNSMLSFYYLLTVRFQVKRNEFYKYEKFIHLSGLLFFPVTALTGIIGNWYSEMQLSMTCWIGEVPKGCTVAGTCTGMGQLIAYVFGGLPIAFTLLSLLVNNTVIYCYVRKSLFSSVVSSSTTTTLSSSMASPTRTASKKELDLLREDNNNDDHDQQQEDSNHIDDETQQQKQHQQQQQQHQEYERQVRQQQQIREVASQGFLYVFTFLLTFTSAFILQVVDSIGYGVEDQSRLYPLLVLNSILLPLQGFFNVFIYVKPNYSRFHAANPNQSRLTTLRQALLDPNIPKLTSVSVAVLLQSGRGSGCSNGSRRRSSRRRYSSDRRNNNKNNSGGRSGISSDNGGGSDGGADPITVMKSRSKHNSTDGSNKFSSALDVIDEGDVDDNEEEFDYEEEDPTSLTILNDDEEKDMNMPGMTKIKEMSIKEDIDDGGKQQQGVDTTAKTCPLFSSSSLSPDSTFKDDVDDDFHDDIENNYCAKNGGGGSGLTCSSNDDDDDDGNDSLDVENEYREAFRRSSNNNNKNSSSTRTTANDKSSLQMVARISMDGSINNNNTNSTEICD